MNKFLLSTAFLLLTGQAFAFTAKCSLTTEKINFQSDTSIPQMGPEQYDLGFWSLNNVICKTKNHIIIGKANLYGVSAFVGGGLIHDEEIEQEARHLVAGASLFISCPLVSEKRLIKRITKAGSFGLAGPKATGALGPLGMTIGLGMNSRGALCGMGSPIFGFGFQSGLTEIKFTEAKARTRL